jgi:hypothetical protein
LECRGRSQLKAESDQIGGQDKREPMTNGAPSSLPSLNIRIVGGIGMTHQI